MGLTYAFAGVGLAWHTASPAHPWMGEGTPGAADLDLGLAGPREGLQGQGGSRCFKAWCSVKVLRPSPKESAPSLEMVEHRAGASQGLQG